MTGRGRGRPPKAPTPPGGMDPNGPRYPAQQQMPGAFPSSFTTDILNQLAPPKQAEMIALVNRFKSKQISIQEFLGLSKNLLGERLYPILAQGMSSAVRVPGTAGGDPFQRPMMPMVRPPPGTMPIFPGQTFPGGAPMQPPNSSAAADDFGDVTKMDTGSLQDVIQYSGIDLRAEAEMIESEVHIPAAGLGPAAALSQDMRMRPEYYFNLARMKAIVYMSAKARGITAVSDEVFELIALALQRRLLNIITGIVEISKHRVDAGRLPFKIKVENDPKKQLWLLERVYEEEIERNQQAILQGQSTKPGDAAGAKPKKASVGEKKSSGEDVIVKTRLANTTAMAALGLQQKSWMQAGIQSMAASSSTASRQDEAASQDGKDPTGNAAMDNVKIPLHFSQAPSSTPVTDRDLIMQINQRTLSLKDLVFYCERDPHLARSPIMLTLYDLSNY